MVSSAGAIGEASVPVATWMPSALQASKSMHLGVAADERDQLELGHQALEQRARKGDPLADRDDRLGALQPFRQFIQVARRLREADNVVSSQELVALQPVHDILVIVGDRYAHWLAF